jgi:hypothetical protein
MTVEPLPFPDLALDAVPLSRGRLYAGFLPDLAAAVAFDGLGVEGDETRCVSPLLTERTIVLGDAAGRRVRLKLFVGARGGADPRRGLVSDLQTFMHPFAIEDGGRLGVALGEFTRLEEARPYLSFVAFGRRNVVVSLLNEGTPPANILAQAEALDDQLRASPEYDRRRVVSLSPRVEAFEVPAGRIEPLATVPLVLVARCPQEQQLGYRFEVGHGTVDQISGRPARFLYETGAAVGPRALTAYVTSRSGLTTVRRLDFDVG